MVSVNWDVFAGLPGAATYNFEMLCRHLMHRHYAGYGDFRALANQPGVEFHLRLISRCSLGEAGRWFGWQCRWYGLPPGRALGTTRKDKIKKAIQATLQEVPGITDWILWTRYPLTSGDQTWFYGLTPVAGEMKLTLWDSSNVEEHLAGPGELYRESYFGDLVLTPDTLGLLHEQSVAPVRFRWLPEAHQAVEAERMIRRMLGDNSARAEVQSAAATLTAAQRELAHSRPAVPAALGASFTAFTDFLGAASEHLQKVGACMEHGDWQTLRELLDLALTVTAEHHGLVRGLRNQRVPVTLRATNALDDLDRAVALLSSVRDELAVSLVAVVADAGNGKTHLSAQLTAADADRPAGIFLRGRQLSTRTTLNEIAGQLTINGRPCASMEALLAAVDAAGERARRRLPIVIDGLNEAEDPRDWRGHLSAIRTLLLRYPHVLLVCSLRGGFADSCLPPDSRQVTIEGFAGDHAAAIARYFDYYKIDSTDADLPEWLLDNPLTLRLFCEVTNPDRAKTVGVEAMPGSLSAVFDRYLEQVGDRIAELSPGYFRIYQPQVRQALEQIGSALWKHNANAIGFSRLRGLIDTDPRWDCSMVRMLEEEGVLLRTPVRDRPNETAMIISYDSLAGHIIANAILASRDRNAIARWLVKPTTTSTFTGTAEKRQPLAEDVFAALAALLPRRMGRQLWTLVGRNLRERALLLAADLEPGYIDGPTVEALGTCITDQPDQRDHLLSRLRLTRAAVNHPLNARFLDMVLRPLEVAQRDLAWSEWIRRHQRDLARDLRELEDKWRSGQPARERDALRALWVMWVLTSTVKELRDQATRTLYWFGRNHPQRLFNLGLESLDINDAYVPQRVIAACYGISMAHQIHDDTFATVLPGFLAGLRTSLVGDQATRPVNDWLLRLYAQGIFLLARAYYPGAVPAELSAGDELEFGAGRSCKPMSTGNAQGDEMDSTLHMDFANYTVGRLFRDRGNYNDAHPGYRQVLDEIRGTVWDLGWRRKDFEAIDRSISDGSYGPGSEYSGHTERYGKKYSWIGFYNVAGQLQSRGELRPRSERLSDLGIDPSFPDPLPAIPLMMPDWASTTPSSDHDWVTSGEVTVPAEFLRPTVLDGYAGPWIAIGGYLETEMQAPGRQVWGLLNAVLVDGAHAERVATAFASTAYPGRNWIPEGLEDYYTFAGEIPWHPTFGHIHEDDLPYDPYRRPLRLEDMDVEVEVLVNHFMWESYHSRLNNTGTALMPSREMSRALNLRARAQLFHQYDPAGIAATLSYGPPPRMNGYLLYMREDLLRTYAKGRELVMLWWGERLPRPYHQDHPDWLTNARSANKEVWRKVAHFTFKDS